MISAFDDNIIRSNPCEICRICGTVGTVIYRNLPDRLFGSTGTWNLKECRNSQCGLVWIDPMPIEEDIHKAYQKYYTHDSCVPASQSSALKRVTNGFLGQIYSLVIGMSPLRKERNELDQMYLGDIKPGRLLELGCGDGLRLARLRALGWEVEGQEVDPKSAAYVRSSQDIQVHLGSLEQLALPENSYDAIVMNHVIEHVHDPLKLLAECRRLLKPGGVYVASTPNIKGLGHKIFKAFWIGLDPPRHLLLFSKSSLQLIAQNACFSRYEVWTTAANAYGLALGSLKIRFNKAYLGHELHLTFKFLAALFQLWARVVYVFQKESGEECVIRLTK